MKINQNLLMIIGIGGVSRSGKSTLSQELLKYFREKGLKTIIFHQDDFVFPENQIPKIRERTDWESPLSMNFGLYQEILEIFKTKFDVIIAEGLFAFYDKSIVDMYDYQIHVKITQRTFYIRRQMDTRWGYEPTWYIEHVWKSYLMYGKPEKSSRNLYSINGENNFNIPLIIRNLKCI